MAILLTLVAYISAAALPRGKPAAMGIGIGFATGVLIWALVGAGAEDEAATIYRLLLILAGIGLLMGAVAQVLRLALPREGLLSKAYPAILLTVAVVAPMVARSFLG